MNTEFENSIQTNSEEETTMNCDLIWDLLSVYADGEATPDEAAMVERHTAGCADCARDLAFMQNTSFSLNEVAEIEPPVMLRDAIMAATVNRPTFPQRVADAVRRTLVPAPVRYGALAAAAGAAAITLVAMNSDNDVLPNPVEYTPARPPVVADLPKSNVELLRPTPGSNHRTEIIPSAVAKRDPNRPIRPTFTFAYRPSTGTSRRVKINVASTHKPNGRPAASGATTDATIPSVAPTLENEIRDEEPMSEPSGDILTAKATETGPSGPASVTDTPTAGTDKAAVRMQLVASGSPISAGQVATLADVKRSLRSQNALFNSRSLQQSLKEKEIRLDVIRGTF